jgi:hypothetical protein
MSQYGLIGAWAVTKVEPMESSLPMTDRSFQGVGVV